MVRGYDFTTGVTVSGRVGELMELNLGSRGLGIIFFSLSIIDLLKQIYCSFINFLMLDGGKTLFLVDFSHNLLINSVKNDLIGKRLFFKIFSFF